MKKRIVILGDSLTMPRCAEGLKYNDTYPHLLGQYGYDVINRSKRANDTTKQCEPLNISDDISDLEADVFIIHLGIVDCAPRIFTKKESKILSLLSSRITNPIINTASKYRKKITKYRKITYVNQYDFEKNLRYIIRNIGADKKVFLIQILNTNYRNKDRSYNIEKNINCYNEKIKKVALDTQCVLINPNLLPCANKLLDDGIHIHRDMHFCLALKIKEQVE